MLYVKVSPPASKSPASTPASGRKRANRSEDTWLLSSGVARPYGVRGRGVSAIETPTLLAEQHRAVDLAVGRGSRMEGEGVADALDGSLGAGKQLSRGVKVALIDKHLGGAAAREPDGPGTCHICLSVRAGNERDGRTLVMRSELNRRVQRQPIHGINPSVLRRPWQAHLAGWSCRAAIWRATMAASSPTPFKSEDLRLRRKWTPTK
jgi:hypothetical protein